MKKLSLAIVDDHKLIRQMWVMFFADNPGIEVIGESGTLADAIEMVKSKRPDILLLDINLAEDSGLDAVPQVRKLSPGTKIIAVSMHNQVAYAKRMLQLGARAYLTKNSSQEEMFKAIKVVIEGGIYVCTEIADTMSGMQAVDEPAGSDIKKLSMREIEIIKCIKDGLSSKEISSKLYIGIRTVEVHRRNILKKLNLRNTALLINFVNQTDLNFI
jgi:two-component system invasion response regulator UvrY